MASGKPPITRHPLFPATVALWFGALFGLGGLALRPALIESAIASLKLEALVPLPLDMTTRILIAAALAAIGGILGAWLARRLGRTKTVARPRKRARFVEDRETADQPGESDMATAPVVRTRRRSQLAMPDPAKSDVGILDRAPVPGATPVLNVAQIGVEGFTPENEAPADRETEATVQPVDESAAEVTLVPGADDEASPPLVASLQPHSPAAEPGIERPKATAALPRLTGDDEEPAFTKLASQAQPLFNRAPDSGLTTPPLQTAASAVAGEDDASGPVEAAPAVETAAKHYNAPISDASAAERIMSAPIEDLGPIELLERLAISLRQKRDIAAQVADDLPDAEPKGDTAAAMIADGADGAEAKVDEPVSSSDAVVAPEPVIPSALRPVGIEPVDDEDILPGYIPPRQIGSRSS